MMGNYPGWNGPAAMGPRVTLSAAAWTKVCGANERRIALILPGTESDTTYYSFSGDDSDLTGLPVLNTASPMLLSRALHGGLVTRAWFARGVAGGGIIRCIEGFDDE